MTTEATQVDSTNPAPQAAPAPQPIASTITPEIQAMIDAAKSSAYNAGAKDARTSIEAKIRGQDPKPPAPTPTPAPRTDDLDARALISLRDAFDDAVGDLTLKATQRKLLRTAVMRDAPTDVTKYVADFVADAAWTSTAPAVIAAPAHTLAPTPQPIIAPPGAPVTDRSPPPPPYVVTDSTPLVQMRPHDRDAVLKKLIAEHGWQKGNDVFAERFMSELKGDNVRVATGR